MRLLMLLGALLFIVSGCTNSTKNQSAPSPNNQDTRIHAQQSASNQTDMSFDGNVSNHLERLAKSIPRVNNATCVVIGNVAIVGIDVDGSLDRGTVGTIKYSVAEALRKDPQGKNAIVTADIDIRNRLREIRNDVNNGRPIRGFAEELADIVGRIIPQLPRDTAPKGEPQGNPNDHTGGDQQGNEVR